MPVRNLRHFSDELSRPESKADVWLAAVDYERWWRQQLQPEPPQDAIPGAADSLCDMPDREEMDIGAVDG
jgi:hypothetical protein